MNDAGRHGTGGLAERLGIFARTFPRDTPEEVAAAVARAGYPLGHWNFAAVGRSTLAADVGRAEVAAVRRAFDRAGVAIPSVSATFNVIHPDPARRAAQTAQAARLIGLVPELGPRLSPCALAPATLTTCGGPTRATWPATPGPTCGGPLTPCWRPRTRPGCALASSPSRATSCGTPGRQRGSWASWATTPPAGVVLDPANLLTPETISHQSELLAEAVDLLGPRVVGIQAKDVAASGAAAAAGAGLRDYPAVLGQLARLPPVPLIVQDASEADAARVRADLLRWEREAS